MARNIAVNDLLAQIRVRSGVRVITVSDAELLAIANSGAAELHDLVIKHNKDWFLDYQDIDVVEGTNTYSLDADYYETRAVSILDSSGEWVDMPQMAFEHRNEMVSGSRGGLHFSIVGSLFRVFPDPEYSETAGIRHWFTPAYTVLVADATVDFQNDWAEYIRIFAGIELAELMGEPIAGKERRLMKLAERISSKAKMRSSAEPARVLIPDEYDSPRRKLDRFGRTV